MAQGTAKQVAHLAHRFEVLELQRLHRGIVPEYPLDKVPPETGGTISIRDCTRIVLVQNYIRFNILDLDLITR